MSKTKIEVIGRGIYGRDGEIEIGTEIEISGEVPEGWKDRVRVVGEKAKPDAKPVTNPAKVA